MDSSSNPIEAVRARLDGGRKWHKGSFDDGEATCLLGAALDVGAETLDMRDVIAEQFPDRTVIHATGHASLPSFNDHPDTTWADVDLVLDKAARAWDEAVR